MRRWLAIVGVLGSVTFLLLAFDYWCHEPYRRRARFDAVEIGMTKEEVVSLMGNGKQVLFFYSSKEYCTELPVLLRHTIRPRFQIREDPFEYSFVFDEELVLCHKKVIRLDCVWPP